MRVVWKLMSRTLCLMPDDMNKILRMSVMVKGVVPWLRGPIVSFLKKRLHQLLKDLKLEKQLVLLVVLV